MNSDKVTPLVTKYVGKLQESWKKLVIQIGTSRSCWHRIAIQSGQPSLEYAGRRAR